MLGVLKFSVLSLMGVHKVCWLFSTKPWHNCCDVCVLGACKRGSVACDSRIQTFPNPLIKEYTFLYTRIPVNFDS